MSNNKRKTKSQNYWLESGFESKKRPSLKMPLDVDVAILGAGFTGLWTAYYLLQEEPSLNIVILEKESVGFGASGRNGGWSSPKFSVTPKVAIERFGMEQTQKLHYSLIDSVNEIERVIKTENIDADWENSGSLKVAIGEHLLPNLEKEMEIYDKLGLTEHYRYLSKEQTDLRIRIDGLKGSILTKPSAVLHPGKMVKQLASILETRGVTIYEHTKVESIAEGNNKVNPKLVTNKGNVSAKKAVVVAGEAFLSQNPNFRRRLIPMYTSIVLTEPLSDQQWSEIGWKNRETVGSNNLSVDYLQRTIDGRILFGLGNSSPYHFASAMNDIYDTFSPSIKLQKKRALKWFPVLNPKQFTHKWGGPIGVTRDWTPNITFDKKTRVAQAWGYAGQGVSTSNLAARIMTDLMYERESIISSLPMVNHQSPKWEIEPFRWIGAKYIKYKMNQLDDKSINKGKAPTGKSIAERIVRH